MSTEIFSELKKGINGMVEAQKRTDQRIDAVEQYLTERKGQGLGVSLPGVNAGKEKFSFAKAIAGISHQAMGQNAWVKIGAGFEKEVLDQATKKALDTGTGGAGGGWVVPVEY